MSATALLVLFGLPLLLKLTLPKYTERPFWSLRLREIATPLRTEWLPLIHVRVSWNVMSVVGDSSAKFGPSIRVKPATVAFGMPSDTNPGASNSSG